MREEEKKKKKSIFVKLMNLSDRRPLFSLFRWNTTDEIDEEMEMTFSLHSHRSFLCTFFILSSEHKTL